MIFRHFRHFSQIFSFIFSRKTIEIPIMEEDSYEKNVIFYVTIGAPIQLAGKKILLNESYYYVLVEFD